MPKVTQLVSGRIRIGIPVSGYPFRIYFCYPIMTGCFGKACIFLTKVLGSLSSLVFQKDTHLGGCCFRLLFLDEPLILLSLLTMCVYWAAWQRWQEMFSCAIKGTDTLAASLRQGHRLVSHQQSDDAFPQNVPRMA